MERCGSAFGSHSPSLSAVLLAPARRFDQSAIFWFDGGRFWLLGALVDAKARRIPREGGYDFPGDFVRPGADFTAVAESAESVGALTMNISPPSRPHEATPTLA